MKYSLMTMVLFCVSLQAHSQRMDSINESIHRFVEEERQEAVDLVERYVGSLENQANRMIFEAMPESTITWRVDVDYVSHPRVSYVKQDANSRCKAMIPVKEDFGFNNPSYACQSKFLTSDGSFMILGEAAQALLDTATKDSYKFFNRTVVAILPHEQWVELEKEYQIKFIQSVSGYDGGLFLHLLTKDGKSSVADFRILKCVENPLILDLGGSEFKNDDQGFKLGCLVPRPTQILKDIKKFKDEIKSAKLKVAQ